MNNRAMRAASGHDVPAFPAGVAGGDAASMLVDSAISHCEKLRRVLQLEEWINATPDNRIFGPTRRKWQEQRERLLSELNLERLSAADTGGTANNGGAANTGEPANPESPAAGADPAADPEAAPPGH